MAPRTRNFWLYPTRQNGSDGWLERNYLKGELIDQMNVPLKCARHNLRLVLKRLKIFCLEFWERFRLRLERFYHLKRESAKLSSSIGLLRKCQ